MRKEILLLIISIILGYILCEIILHIMFVETHYLTEQLHPIEDPIIKFELKPNLDVIDKGSFKRLDPVRVKTNSQGLREDEEHSFQKPENTYRIIFIGDSITFGMHVEQEKTFSHVLENMLPKKYQTLNFAAPLYNLKQESEIIKNKVLKYNPDLVIITFVPNDLDKTNEPYKSKLKSTARKYLFVPKLINYILTQQNSKRINPGIFTKEQYLLLDYQLTELNLLLKKHNITLIVTTPSFYKPSSSYIDYSNHIKELAQKQGFYHFNFIEIFNDIDEEHLKVKGDPHPNALAHQIIAQNIFNQLVKEKII